MNLKETDQLPIKRHLYVFKMQDQLKTLQSFGKVCMRIQDTVPRMHKNLYFLRFQLDEICFKAYDFVCLLKSNDHRQDRLFTEERAVE